MVSKTRKTVSELLLACWFVELHVLILSDVSFYSLDSLDFWYRTLVSHVD